MKALFVLGSVVAAATASVAATTNAPSISKGAAGAVYAAATSATLYARDDTSSAIGTLMPGAAMRKGKAGTSGLERIKFQGWSPQGDAAILYEAVGLRVIVAQLSSSEKGAVTVTETKTDAYGSVWSHVVVHGWVKRDQVTADLSTVWAAARSLYVARCSTCHALHDPKEFSANQWPGVLGPMAQRAGLNQQEKLLITQYLQSHAEPQ